MNRPLVAALSALVLTGCHNLADRAAARDDASPAPVVSQAPGSSAASLYAIPSVPFRTLLKGVHTVYGGDAENAVIRSASDWDDFLARHPHNDPGAISLDFGREQGVLVQLGPQPTGMIQVEIVSIEERPDRFVVHAVRWLPVSDIVTDDIGYPTHYVAMTRSDKPVDFAPVVDAKASERR